MAKGGIVALAVCVLVQSPHGFGQTAGAGIFTLEIPASNFRMAGNSSATLPPGSPTHVQVHIDLQPAQFGYGNIFSRINTESANVIMTTSATATGVNCDFDLARRQGFLLKPGRNSLEIAVQDLRGRLRYASFLLDISAQTPQVRAALPVTTPRGDRYAVVLGISRYRSAGSGIKNLALADRDAAGFRDFLLSPAGGYQADHVEFLLNEDATLERIRAALASVASRAVAEDLVVLFVAGHGVTDPEDQRKSYLLAHDSHPDGLGESALPFSELEDYYGRALKAKSVISYLDVVHGSALTRTPPGTNNLAHQYLVRYASAGARAAMAASDLGESSWEAAAPSDVRSVFAHFVLQGLRSDADVNRDGTVTFGELKTYVRDEVRKATGGQQSPIATQGEGDAMAIAGIRGRADR